MIKVKFYGVRGSIPCPGEQTMKYGGNTSCIELRFPEIGRQVIIDAGSGIRTLANEMLTNDLVNGPIETEIYLTHTHWDHIMGFPFFSPAYLPGTKIKIFGPVTYEDETLEEVVGGQMKYRYFPVNMGELAADIQYIRLKENPNIDLGDGITLATKIINHPITALGYKFTYRNTSFCTAYDTEPYRNLFTTDPSDPYYDQAMAMEGEEVVKEQTLMLEEFFSGVDLLVHDAQYIASEYENGKIGWGHSPIESVIATAKRAGVKSLALYHHDPDRTDSALDELSKKFCSQSQENDMKIFFAREGMEIKLNN